MSWSRATGSMTAPERMWAPTSEPFSTTTTLGSGESCLSLIAAASPAGPAPTITTSNSMASRAGSSSALIGFSTARLAVSGTTVAMNRERSTRSLRSSAWSARRRGYRLFEQAVCHLEPILDRRPVGLGHVGVMRVAIVHSLRAKDAGAADVGVVDAIDERAHARDDRAVLLGRHRLAARLPP